MAAPIGRACIFCVLRQAAKYTCPRCNAPFCSSSCYASAKHANCSEDFYKDWVHTHLQLNGDRSEAKRQILHILEKLKLEEESKNDYPDDDLTPDISERFAEINIDGDDLGVEAIWSRLSEKEKSEFKSLVDSGAAEKLLPIWEPWWMIKETVKLIQEVDNAHEVSENPTCRPKIGTAIPPLEALTKATPSVKLKYNVANVLYVYAFVARFYNGDHNEFPIESVEAINEISECLSKNVTFDDVRQAILSAMKQVQQNRDIPMQESLVLQAASDVKHLVQGPSLHNRNVYVLSALSDLKFLVGKCRKLLKKEERHEFKVKLTPVEKKLDYYQSWTNAYHSELASIVPELDLVQASLAAEWTCFEEERGHVERRRSKPAAKPKIEEID